MKYPVPLGQAAISNVRWPTSPCRLIVPSRTVKFPTCTSIQPLSTPGSNLYRVTSSVAHAGGTPQSAKRLVTRRSRGRGGSASSKRWKSGVAPRARASPPHSVMKHTRAAPARLLLRHAAPSNSSSSGAARSPCPPSLPPWAEPRRRRSRPQTGRNGQRPWPDREDGEMRQLPTRAAPGPVRAASPSAIRRTPDPAPPKVRRAAEAPTGHAHRQQPGPCAGGSPSTFG